MANKKTSDYVILPSGIINNAWLFDIAAAGVTNYKGTFLELKDNIFSWGNARTSTTGVGLTHTIGASAPSGVQSMVTTLNNTQTSALTLHEINLGTSNFAHIGLRINANSINDDLIGNFISLGAGKGTALEIAGAGDFRGININSTSTSSGHEGIFYDSSTVNCNALVFGADVITAGNSRPRYLEVNFDAQSASISRTLDVGSIEIRRNVVGGTVNDDFNILSLKRTNSRAAGTVTATGSIIRLENIKTGVLTDTVSPSQIIQGSGCTGAPSSLTQNNITSTNFRKLNTETNTGFTMWVSDGTTPNGNLTGNTGDVCFNGASGEIFHCTGTTNWTSSIDAPTALINSSNSANAYYFAGLVIDSPGKTAFTISQAPVSNQAFQLYRNGIRVPTTEYTLVGTALTYSGSALAVPSAPGLPDELTAIINTAVSGQPTKSFEHPSEYNANYGNRRVRNIGATGAQRMNFSVPLHFTGTLALKARFFPVSGAGGTGKDMDLAGEYTNVAGGSNTQFIFSDTTSTYNTGVDDTLTELDITHLFPNLAPGTQGGIFWDNKGIGGGLNFIDIQATST